MFANMPEVVPEGHVGIAKVEHFTVNEMAASLYAFHDQNIRPGHYARLKVNGMLYMSDTPYERRTNYGIERHAHGHVLIAGLGLGMILTAIMDKPDVESVTVVEKFQDVIDLVAPHHQHPKLNVVCADIFEWKPPADVRYDVVYFDIWPDICVDSLVQMATLHRRFARWMNKDNPARWMDSWCKDTLKAQKRRNDRNGW